MSKPVLLAIVFALIVANHSAWADGRTVAYRRVLRLVLLRIAQTCPWTSKQSV